MHDVAKHHVADVGRIDLGARHGFAHHARAELCRRKILEAAAVATDGRAHAAHHHYFTFAHVILLESTGLNSRRLNG